MLIVKSNGEVDDNLLDQVLQFDRKIFPVDKNYSLPDDYLKRMYSKYREGIFVLLSNDIVIGYVSCIFLSDEGKNKYLQDRDYIALENIGFHSGKNNMYFHTIALEEKYRNSNAVKSLMTYFAQWLNTEKRNGKFIKSCISEAITNDGVKVLQTMKMIPYDVDDKGLGIYESLDCLESYISQM